ncbi:HB2L protein, partial [Scytalopus superciliaris]|nr:HB2L protein [Scytalopus superciliaris]
PAHTGVLQYMLKSECHYINGTERVRFIERHIYNRQQDVHFDSDVGKYVGDTPYGEIPARNLNKNRVERKRAAVDWYCRPNYEGSIPFLLNRRVLPSPSSSTPVNSSP